MGRLSHGRRGWTSRTCSPEPRRYIQRLFLQCRASLCNSPEFAEPVCNISRDELRGLREHFADCPELGDLMPLKSSTKLPESEMGV